MYVWSWRRITSVGFIHAFVKSLNVLVCLAVGSVSSRGFSSIIFNVAVLASSEYLCV